MDRSPRRLRKPPSRSAPHDPSDGQRRARFLRRRRHLGGILSDPHGSHPDGRRTPYGPWRSRACTARDPCDRGSRCRSNGRCRCANPAGPACTVRKRFRAGRPHGAHSPSRGHSGRWRPSARSRANRVGSSQIPRARPATRVGDHHSRPTPANTASRGPRRGARQPRGVYGEFRDPADRGTPTHGRHIPCVCPPWSSRPPLGPCSPWPQRRNPVTTGIVASMDPPNRELDASR